jgi:hypothetical protein
MQRISMLAMLGLLGAVACEASSGGLKAKNPFDGGPGGGGSGGGGSTGGGGGGPSTGGSGGGLAPNEACKQNIAAFCERTLRCDGTNGLSALGYTSVTDCTTQVQAKACMGASELCGAGQTYHPDKAQLCVNAMKDLACTSQASPAVCDEVCGEPSGGGSLPFANACQKMTETLCAKAFSCGPDSSLSSTVSQYASQAECVSGLLAMCSDNAGCDAGKTYHGDKAKQCLDQYAALSCSDFDHEPAVCKEVCSTSPSSTGGLGDLTPAVVGLSPRETCRQAFEVLCDRCYVTFGSSSKSDCLAKYQSECTTMRESDMCPSGTYKPSKGLACVNAVKAMVSCTDIVSAPACDTDALCN